MHVSHANRFNQRVDLPEFPHFILEKITANGADFADGFLVAVALRATRHKCHFCVSTALRTAKRLQLRSRRCRRCRRLVFRLRLLRAWRRRRSRGLRATSKLGAFFQPRLVILRRIDNQCAFHSVMAKPA